MIFQKKGGTQSLPNYAYKTYYIFCYLSLLSQHFEVESEANAAAAALDQTLYNNVNIKVEVSQVDHYVYIKRLPKRIPILCTFVDSLF